MRCPYFRGVLIEGFHCIHIYSICTGLLGNTSKSVESPVSFKGSSAEAPWSTLIELLS